MVGIKKKREKLPRISLTIQVIKNLDFQRLLAVKIQEWKHTETARLGDSQKIHKFTIHRMIETPAQVLKLVTLIWTKRCTFRYSLYFISVQTIKAWSVYKRFSRKHFNILLFMVSHWFLLILRWMYYLFVSFKYIFVSSSFSVRHLNDETKLALNLLWKCTLIRSVKLIIHTFRDLQWSEHFYFTVCDPNFHLYTK